MGCEQSCLQDDRRSGGPKEEPKREVLEVASDAPKRGVQAAVEFMKEEDMAAKRRLHAWLKPCVERARPGAFDLKPQELPEMRVLELKGSEIGKLPPEIGRLVALRELDLQDNLLTSVPIEIGELVNLKILALNGNHIPVIPQEFGQLTALERLYLQDNKLKRLPSEMAGLHRLERLILARNELVEIPAWLNDLPHLRYFSIAENSVAGPFLLRPLFERLAEDGRAQLQVYGNSFDPVNFGDAKWVTGRLQDPVGTSSVCTVSFPGCEYLEWQLLLARTALMPKPCWSQLCVFQAEYAKAAGKGSAPWVWHVKGFGSEACKAHGRYFEAADEFTNGMASRAHTKFGCCWFQHWTKNIGAALERGHRRFCIFTKLDRKLGPCQTVEWLYLLRIKSQCPEVKLHCVVVSEAMDALKNGAYPAAWEGTFAYSKFRAFDCPEGLPLQVPASLEGPLGEL